MPRNIVKIRPKKNLFESVGVKNIELKEIIIYEKLKKIELLCVVKNLHNLDELDLIQKEINKKFGDKLELDLGVEFETANLTKMDIKLVVERIIKELKTTSAPSRSFLHLYRVYIHDQHIDIELKDQVSLENLLKAEVDIKLNTKLGKYGINNLDIRLLVGDFTREVKVMNDEIIKITKEQIERSNKEIQLKNPANEVVVQAKRTEPRDMEKVKIIESSEGKKIIFGRGMIKGSTNDFLEFNEIYPGEVCTLEGEVFKVEQIEIKNKWRIVKFGITNHEDSISIKIFTKIENKVDIKAGMWVKVKGKKENDQYTNNEDILAVTNVNAIESKTVIRKDEAEIKRIELHAHTKMSDMAGLIDAKDLIKHAHSWGHKAIAVTDFGVTHSFPFAFNVAKGMEDFKVIMGCEAYVVDDAVKMVKNARDNIIEDETYIVFDIETTGFDPHNDEVTEIGAVKLKGTKIIDRFSTFVNPNKPIPENIVKLTGITDELVADAPQIEEVLPKFLEFSKDATMVAHNAKFDIGFIQTKLKSRLDQNYDPAVIDTLLWGRNILKDLKRHNLKAMAKHLGVELDNHHRAVDDAEATAHIFVKMMNMVLTKGAYKLSEIDNVYETDIKLMDTFNTMILVKNQKGLRNLYELVSRAHIDFYGQKKPRIPKSLLTELREGLILASSGSGTFRNEGELTKAYLRGTAKSEIEELAKYYDYFEIHPRGTYTELVEKKEVESYNSIIEMNKYFVGLAEKQGKIVVATGDVQYLNPDEYLTRSVLRYGSGMAFSSWQYDNQLYFRTTNEMIEEFSYLGDKLANDVVINNTHKINEMIEKVQPIPDGFYPPKMDNAEEEVSDMTYAKAYKIYGNPLPKHIDVRIKRELKAIISNGFAVLYLSAQKLVKESLDHGYLVGSRGSVGSSLVAFMMDITEVNALYPHYVCPKCQYSEFMDKEGSGVDLPNKKCPECDTELIRDGHSIPFEVFMGFNGDKVPDIDLNFSGEYQGAIHKYCEVLFGKENVFKAGTISTLAERNAYGYVRKFSEENNKPMRGAEMERIAKKCEGVKKTTGQHPGGMIIVPEGKSIYDFTPVQRPANDQNSTSITTHYDYHVMDEQLVKLDILGHDDPTTIKLLQDLTGVNVYDIPLTDPKTLKLFSSTESLGITPDEIGSTVGTYGVPEFGTGFVRQMLLDTKPTTFSELCRISGLSHGTDVWLNNAQDFVRQGEATLSEIISVRDDIMNFLIDSGIEKGLAFKIMEFVRKGRPSKEPDTWEEYSNVMKGRKVPSWYIESCKRIKYMFPKGHAVAYVMMSVRIAYFKVHYPQAFYTAYLSRKADDFDSDFMLTLDGIKSKIKELSNEPRMDVRQKGQMALSEIILEMNARKVEFLGVDVYKSDGFKFKIEGDKIRLPLVAVNGLGAAVVENMLNERTGRAFSSYEDLKRRTKASATIIEKLKELGSIDGLSDTDQRSLF
ncbi:MAG: PolC-type DNA polymerase III [Psychrilyobacter sp.]|uniref:PolC-type DNA polymerase III n=1 Tax=Psychrilyobacter sp. TaxID=2586924 RepID=UPI003C710D95